MRTHLLTTILAVPFCLGVARGAEPRDGSPSRGSAAGKKGPELWFVISAIKKEGLEAWEQEKPWPRSEMDYAAQKGWTLPRAEVTRALTRKLHPEPAVDAYVRWQLLSFVDDLGDVDVAALNRIADSAPKVVPQPVVREEWMAVSGPGSSFIAISRQVPYVRNLRPVVGNGAVGLNPEVAVVQSGTVVSAEGSTKSYITVIRQANDKLEAARTKAARANETILRYREALAAKMPQRDGLRLGVMIKDTASRTAAGDPSTGRSVQSLLLATSQLPADLTPRTRATLAGWVKELGKMKTTVHDSVAPGEHEKQALIHTHEVAVAEGDIQALLDRLK